MEKRPYFHTHKKVTKVVKQHTTTTTITNPTRTSASTRAVGTIAAGPVGCPIGFQR